MLTAFIESIKLDKNGRTRAVVLDVSKVFDKVGHDGLLHILKGKGVSGRKLVLIQSFLHNV